MAQPPDITETFVKEVDENLRRDQLHDFLRDNGRWLVVALVLFLAVCGGIIYWQHYREQKSEQQVEELAQIFRDIGGGNTKKAPQQLDGLAQSGNKAVRASALFTRAAVALQNNDVPLATQKYREIASDDGLPQAYRDAALVRQTSLEFDKLKPEEVIARMQPLAKSGEPWFGSAGELTAMALIKQGKNQEAGRLFAAIARDKNAPDTLRGRAAQIASTLGVDASDALETQAR